MKVTEDNEKRKLFPSKQTTTLIKARWSIWEWLLLLFLYSFSLSLALVFFLEVIIIINKSLFFLPIVLTSPEIHLLKMIEKVSRGCAWKRESNKKVLDKYPPVVISVNKGFHRHVFRVSRAKKSRKSIPLEEIVSIVNGEFDRGGEVESNRFFVCVYSSRAISVVNRNFFW